MRLPTFWLPPRSCWILSGRERSSGESPFAGRSRAVAGKIPQVLYRWQTHEAAHPPSAEADVDVATTALAGGGGVRPMRPGSSNTLVSPDRRNESLCLAASTGSRPLTRKPRRRAIRNCGDELGLYGPRVEIQQLMANRSILRRSPPAPRRETGMILKDSGEMRLIREAAGEPNLR
jgi:hypothetical protein